MQLSSCPLEDIIPHREPMVLLDRVVSADLDGRRLTAEFVARPEWSENWASIEYMAQAAAAMAGLTDRAAGEKGPPKLGFLLGTRRLELDFDRFRPGCAYRVEVHNEFSDSEAASFDCAIVDDGGRTVARALLSAYRPKDIDAFVKERKT